MLDRAGLDPLRARRRRALHEKEIAVDAIWIALHHHGTIGQMGQENRGDIDIVLKQISLGNSQILPK